PRRTLLEVVPGDLEVVRGDEPAIAVRLSGSLPRTAEIRRRALGGGAEATWMGDEVVVDGGLFGAGAAADTVHYRFEAARSSFEYQVLAGDADSPVYRVEVIEPPAVRRLRLTLRYPVYSGLPARVEEDGGDIRALAGTAVELEVRATKPLARAAAVFEAPDSSTRRLEAAVEDDGARLAWRLEGGGDGYYRLELTDRRGIANRDPIRYAVQVLADGPPAVSIVDPGRDSDLPEGQRATLTLEASDDFGVAAAALVYRVNEGAQRRLPLPAAPGPEVHLSYLWDLSDLELLPEDRIYYRAEVEDNDAVTGPKRASSPEYAFRFPSLYELLGEVAQTQEEQLKGLEELAAEEGQARDYVEQLRREVLKRDELTWEQRKELEATLAAEEDRARELAELAEQLDETVEKLQEHGLASAEVVEKLQEIRQLMASVTSPELQEALAALQESLGQLKPEDIAAALEEFARNQQAFEERLDRTLALLRQVHAEQRLEAAARQAADLRDRQARIDADLEQLPGEADFARLGEQESSLERDARRLQVQLPDLSQDLGELSPPVGAGLQDATGMMERQELSGRMGRMTDQLRARQSQAARRTGQGLEEDLGTLASQLQDLQSQFTGEQKRQLAAQLKRSMWDLLHLSERQEDLARRTGRARQGLPELAAEQFALFQGTGIVVQDVARVGQRTLTLSLALPATLGRALRSMDQAAGHLGQLDPQASATTQVEATGYLNEAIEMLRQSARNLEQAAAASGFAEAMQKMMGLSEQQAALNQATQRAFAAGVEPGMEGRGNPDQRQDMARLAAEQQRIYRALAELERELRGQQGLEKRVGSIREEMESVLKELGQSRPRPQVMQSQNRILQRLLDASRSIHSRGFEQKRRSETGAEVAYEGPDGLPAELGQSRDRLREAMRAALAGGYPREYRQLIRRYYEMLYGDVSEGAVRLDGGEARP
ncbi:MAG: DUF4175 family protein, partial [Gemmatimonadota bacterium]